MPPLSPAWMWFAGWAGGGGAPSRRRGCCAGRLPSRPGEGSPTLPSNSSVPGGRNGSKQGTQTEQEVASCQNDTQAGSGALNIGGVPLQAEGPPVLRTSEGEQRAGVLAGPGWGEIVQRASEGARVCMRRLSLSSALLPLPRPMRSPFIAAPWPSPCHLAAFLDKHLCPRTGAAQEGFGAEAFPCSPARMPP